VGAVRFETSTSSAFGTDHYPTTGRRHRGRRILLGLVIAALMASSCLNPVHAADVDIATSTMIGIDLDAFTGATAEVFSGVTVSNDINGTLIGANYSAISALTSTWTLTNGGTISIPNLGGSGPAVLFSAGGVLDNHGLVQTLTNNAVQFTNGGTVTNVLGGTISGAWAGVQIGGAAGLVTNAGHISSAGGGGVNLLAGGSVVNQAGATIHTEGNSNVGVYVTGGTSRSVENAGIIESVGGSFATGIEIGNGDGSIVNHAAGSIHGTYNGIYTGSSGNLSISNAGTISSLNGPAIEFRTTGTITNTGTIEKTGGGNAITFGGTHIRTLNLGTGSLIIGNVVGGANGTDNLVLQGTGTEDIAKFLNFETLTMEGTSWSLTGNSTFSTSATIEAGILNVAGQLTSPAIDILADGTLSGIGTLIGNVTIGGKIAPGNSIGTLTVSGGAAFNAGSTYEIEIDDGGNVAGVNNDLVIAGTATIASGAIFHVVPEDGAASGANFAANTQYTIIQTAAPGNLTVNGAPTITDAFAFLDFSGHDDGQYFYLTSSAVAGSFCLAGASFNQCQAGEAVRDLGPGHVAFDAVIGMGEAAANAAFNAMSGEIHASGQHLVDLSSGLFRRTLRGQGTAWIAGISSGKTLTAPLGYSPSVRPTSLPAGIMAADTPGLSIDAYANERVARAWLAPVGEWGGVDADGNAGELDFWTAGAVGGYERPIEVPSGQAHVGFGLGYLRSHGSADARRSSLDADGFHVGAYGGWTGGPWSLAGSLAYAAHSISTARRIAFGDIDETAGADYWSHTIGFSGEAAYRFDLASGTSLSPLATLDVGWSGHGGFTETDAGALNLEGNSESWKRFDTGLGIALQHDVLTETGKMILHGRLVWEHAFADVVPSQTLAFAGSAAGFEVRGPDAGRDRVRLGLGISFEATEDITIRAGYSGLYSGNQQSHGAGISFKIRF